jgi:hypothetical protein
MNRRLPLVLVAGLLALCVVGVIVVGVDAGSGFGAVAYTVGGTKVSQRSVNADLRTLAEHDDFSTQNIAATFRTTNGAVSSSAAADWLTVEIYRQRGSQILAKRGQPITDSQRKAVIAAIVAQGGASFQQGLKTLPAGLQRRLADILVIQQKVTGAKALQGVEVTVDPKYGFWSARRHQVCPPSGCRAASSSSSSSGSSSSAGG